MTQQDSCKYFDSIMNEINYDINLLYVIQCDYTKNIILNHLRERLHYLESIINGMCQSVYIQPQPTPQPGTFLQIEPPVALQPSTNENQAIFTLQELSRYNGKNGNPAYIAINGTVYDITNNAAWAAGTHFGLSAGNDLTNEFASCHANQPILNTLPVVGKIQTM